MPELTFAQLPIILSHNKVIQDETTDLIQKYLQNDHKKGWPILEGVRRWIEENFFLIQAPIEDKSLGGFLLTKESTKICYINTWHPRVYQNFVLFHELYHILSNGKLFSDNLHVVDVDLVTDIEERKADYFASLLLIGSEQLKKCFLGLQNEPLLSKILRAMDVFSAPYKAILIRLFELNLIESSDLTELFDKKLDLEREFKDLGLDPYKVQRSLVVNFSRLEQLMDEDFLPEIARIQNKETLNRVKEYFENYRGGESV